MNANKSTAPTVQSIQAATATLNRLHQQMPFLHPLTPPERRQFGRMGTQAVRTTAQRLEAARQHRDALPPAFDLRQFERETALLVALNDCLMAADRMQSDVRDTLLSLGSGTVHTGKQVCAVIQVLAEAGDKLGRTVNSLKRSRTSRRQTDAVPAGGPAEEPAPAADAAVPATVPPGSPSSESEKAA